MKSENPIELFKLKFIEEAISLITDLESSVLELENNSEKQEYVQEIFRVMHTLKGISGMYGFQHISDYTHHLENIYDLIRLGKISLTKQILNITFSSIDLIRQLLQDEKVEKFENKERFERLMMEVSQVITDYDFTTKSKKDEITTDDGYGFFDNFVSVKTYYIIFQPNEDIVIRGIDLLSIFKDLAALGEYKIIWHNFIEENSFANCWGIYLVTEKDIDDINTALLFIQSECKILKISDSNIFINSISNDQLEQLNNFLNTSEKKATILELVENVGVKQSDGMAANENIKNAKSVVDGDEIKLVNTENIVQQITSRISVDSAKLDTLMFLVSELVTTRAQFGNIVAQKDYLKLDVILEKIDKLSKGFRDNALSIRLIPINDIVIRFKRLIRDLSQKLGKDVKFVTQGTETELDKSIIDMLVEPIMHIVRNCIDHGIETPEERLKKGKPKEGIVKFTSFYSGTNVYIQIQDDGSGIDTEKILKKAIEKGFIAPESKLSKKDILNLIFLPGFSTAESLTDVSGRGVGMDVVRKKISEIHGEVEIESEIGEGTTFLIKLQQTISIIDTLLVKAANTHFLIPMADIDICDQRQHSEIFSTQNKQIEFNQNLVPFVHLRSEFGLSGDAPKEEKIIFVNKNDFQYAIVVDKIIGEYSAVLKPLGKMFKNEVFLAGASILGDGNMALMLDTAKLMSEIFADYFSQAGNKN